LIARRQRRQIAETGRWLTRIVKRQSNDLDRRQFANPRAQPAAWTNREKMLELTPIKAGVWLARHG
jgi:hypothetical protein